LLAEIESKKWAELDSEKQLIEGRATQEESSEGCKEESQIGRVSMFEGRESSREGTRKVAFTNRFAKKMSFS